MPTSHFDSRLKQLTAVQQNCFIIALTQRVKPNYQLFSEHAKFGDSNKFSDFINLAWQSLSSPHTKINFELQQEKFEAYIPNITDFDMYGVYPALDACVMLTSAFNAIISPLPEEAEEAVNASKTSLGTVIMLLEMQHDEELTNDQLKLEPLFQVEIEFQETILEFIENNVINKDNLRRLQALANNSGVSNIGVSLED